MFSVTLLAPPCPPRALLYPWMYVTAVFIDASSSFFVYNEGPGLRRVLFDGPVLYVSKRTMLCVFWCQSKPKIVIWLPCVRTHTPTPTCAVSQDEDNDYQFDGFVVGDDEASEEEEPERRSPKSSSRRNKRKRLRKAKEGLDAMDDEDLELIREAQGVSVRQTREYDGNELMASDGRDLGNQLFAGQGGMVLLIIIFMT